MLPVSSAAVMQNGSGPTVPNRTSVSLPKHRVSRVRRTAVPGSEVHKSEQTDKVLRSFQNRSGQMQITDELPGPNVTFREPASSLRTGRGLRLGPGRARPPPPRTRTLAALRVRGTEPLTCGPVAPLGFISASFRLTTGKDARPDDRSRPPGSAHPRRPGILGGETETRTGSNVGWSTERRTRSPARTEMPVPDLILTVRFYSLQKVKS